MSSTPSKGFTILEMMIVVAMIAIVATFSTPVGINLYRSQIVFAIQSQLIDSLGTARSQSVLQKGDTSYGLYLATSTASFYTIYQGVAGDANATYATRDATKDDKIEIQYDGTQIVLPHGVSEIRFAKLTGTPSVTGTISITRSDITKNILIDSFGNAVVQ